MGREASGGAGDGPCVRRFEPGKHACCTCRQSARFPLCDGTHRQYRDAEGRAFRPIKFLLEQPQTLALCTCGRTKDKPFCDGSHATPTPP